MSDQTEDRTVQIVSSNLERLDKEIAKLNKRADKIDCPHVGYIIHETKMVRDPIEVRKAEEEAKGQPIDSETLEAIPYIRVCIIEIVGNGPKVEGWKFVGTLDHYTIPGKVIVNTVPGEVVPERYFEHEASCDHCEKIRYRVETFVLEGIDENEGEYKLVGRSCLKDFFGHDPMYVARWLNRVWKFIETLEAKSRGWGGGRYTTYYKSEEVLTTTAAIIRTFGWLAKSAAGYEKIPTAGHVVYALNRPSSPGLEDWRTFMSAVQFDEEKDLEEAQASVAWLKAKDADNEYIHNLKLLENERYIPSKMIGYWCSLVAAYQRENARLEYQKKERAKLTDEYVGTVGERIETTVECVGVKSIFGDYGVINIHRMIDEEGRTLVWFANANRKMEEGERYNVRVGIKKHDKFRDWKQTTVSRLHVVEHIQTEEAA